MASEDESQGFDTHHEDKDWDSAKENFRICYIDMNLTRKDAAAYMEAHYGFKATPRQWERKIKQWGFSKYMGREERLAQIAQVGKTVDEVSRPGRRTRSNVDQHGNLLPHEDRNLRRFARREVGRSRSRSRSTSFTGREPPRMRQEYSDTNTLENADPDFDFNDLTSDVQRTPSNESFQSPPLDPSVNQIQAYPTIPFHDTGVMLPLDHNQWTTPQTGAASQYDSTAHVPYDAFAQPSMGLALPATEPFPVMSTAAFGYAMPDNTFTSGQDGFEHYSMPRASIGSNSGMLPNDLLTDQDMFNESMRLPHSDSVLAAPTFVLNGVDMDPSVLLPTPSITDAPNSISMSSAFSDLALDDDGPLRNDVLPKIEEFTRAIQTVALSSLASTSYHSNQGDHIAMEMLQPTRAFMSSMAVFLDNYTKTQQRSLQSIKDTCRHLRQRNAMLEQARKNDLQSIAAAEAQARRASVPVQASMYNDMYQQTF